MGLSWRSLENDPREIRAAAVDAQRISDWLMARERERSLGDDKAQHERPDGGTGGMREQDHRDRSTRAASEGLVSRLINAFT